MVSIVDKYFSLNRTILQIVGLWPYQKSKLSRIQLFCCFGIVESFIICQFTTFFTSKCTVDHIIRILSLVIGVIGTAINYHLFCINCDTVKYLMEQLQHTYDELKDNEIAIVNRYGNYAKRYTFAFTTFPFCSVFVIIIQMPYFKSRIFYINESQLHQLDISIEYFIDQEKYYYIILFHISAALFIAITVLTATGAMIMAYLQHVCGMFKIASYRIKNTIEKCIQNINMKNKKLAYEGLIHGVNIHRKAIMLSDYLITKFELLFMSLIVLGVIVLSLNVFRILSFNYKTVELPIAFVIICVCFVYMFLANLSGQNITDHYNLLFVTAYEVEWYTTPLYIQKFLLFLLLRGNKIFGLRAGGLFTGSLQSFTTLINASLSYFVVLYSMRQ